MKRIAVLASIAAVLLSLVAVARADELKVLRAGTMHFALKDGGATISRARPALSSRSRMVARAKLRAMSKHLR